MNAHPIMKDKQPEIVLDSRNIFSYDNNESTCFLHQLTFWSTPLQIKIYNNVRYTKKNTVVVQNKI